MSLPRIRADKARRVLEGDPAQTDQAPRRIVSKAPLSWWRRGLAAVAVSGIGIGAIVSLGTSGAFTGVAFAGQFDNSSTVAEAETSSEEPAPPTLEELAAQRNAAMARTSRSVAEAKEQAILELRQENLEDAADSVEAEAERLRNLEIFLWPTSGSVGSPWGRRLHPILGYYRLHDGVDIGGKCGQPIYAAQSGEVIKAASSGYNGGSGINVRIDHGDINGHDIETGYLHMSKLTVKVGQQVNKGDLIGYVGNTGLSTSCHLHLSLYKDGTGIDPLEYVKKSESADAKAKEEEQSKEDSSDAEELPADPNQEPDAPAAE